MVLGPSKGSGAGIGDTLASKGQKARKVTLSHTSQESHLFVFTEKCKQGKVSVHIKQ